MLVQCDTFCLSMNTFYTGSHSATNYTRVKPEQLFKSTETLRLMQRSEGFTRLLSTHSKLF